MFAGTHCASLQPPWALQMFKGFRGGPGLTQPAGEQPLIDSICVASHFLQPENTAAYHITGSNTTCIINFEKKGFLTGFPKEMGVQSFLSACLFSSNKTGIHLANFNPI